MKRSLLLMFAFLMATVSMFAQKKVKTLPGLPSSRTSIQVTPNTCRAFANRGTTRRAPIMKADGDELVTPPSGVEPEEWAVDGMLYSSGEDSWENITAEVPSVNVVFDGADVYIQGLAYWFEEAWIKGTLSEGVVTFPASTYVGTDEYGDEYLIGSSTGSDVCEITFTYDEEKKVLDCQTLIIESSAPDQVKAYCYWAMLSISKDIEPVVEAPDDLFAAESMFVATVTDENGSEVFMTPVLIGFENGMAYIQGVNPLLPEAWIAGTTNDDDHTITFPTGQYYGKYQGSYKLYFVGLTAENEFTDVVFKVSDDNKGIYTDQIVGLCLSDPTNPEQLLETYSDVKIVRIDEKAATPSDPTIEYDEDEYGGYVECFIPLVDTDGDYMLPSKLSYKIFKDIKGEVSEHTFTTDNYVEIEEDMTEVPYYFTDNYDIGAGAKYVYLYSDDVDDWNKVGIQVTYNGKGEAHSSEIIWFTIKSGDLVDYSFDFNSMTVPVSSNSSHDGDITEDLTITEEDVSLTITPSGANTANRWWKANNVTQLRVYGGTMTFTTESGDNIKKIEFYYNKWDSRNIFDPEGKEVNDVDTKVVTWTGSSSTVVVDLGSNTNTQLNKVVVYVDDPTATGIETVTKNVREDGVFYNLSGQRVTNPQRGIYIVNGKKVLVK